MSNLVLGNLSMLKQHLLGAALRTSSEFDEVIMAIGRGVGRQIERYCVRQLPRTVGDTFTFYADRTMVVLPRYPIESVSNIQQKTSESEGWVSLGAVNDYIASIGNDQGILQFGAQIGSHLQLIRVTYTGGYVVEVLEPDEPGYPTAVAAGSAALPDDIQLAWLLQCGEVWNKRDKLGLGLADAPDTQTQLNTLQLTDGVKAMLNPHRRYA